MAPFQQIQLLNLLRRDEARTHHEGFAFNAGKARIGQPVPVLRLGVSRSFIVHVQEYQIVTDGYFRTHPVVVANKSVNEQGRPRGKARSDISRDDAALIFGKDLKKVLGDRRVVPFGRFHLEHFAGCGLSGIRRGRARRDGRGAAA